MSLRSTVETTVSALLFTMVVGSPPVSADPITLISRESTGAQTANAGSGQMRWDALGRFGVFISGADDLVPGQTSDNSRNAFLYDRATGAVGLVSHIPGSSTQAVDSNIDEVQISADGTG